MPKKKRSKKKTTRRVRVRVKGYSYTRRVKAHTRKAPQRRKRARK